MQLLNIKWSILFFLTFSFLPNFLWAQSAIINKIKVKNPSELKQFFSYSKDRIPLISAHRGGARKGFPENCIPTFENTLQHTHAIMEIDPRLTKDSVVILMHDATLDRTTNGTGKVSDHTWEELNKLNLKDPDGNVTEYGIPTLDEVLEWAKGKTIVILDKKTVPMEITERKIREHGAEANAMVIPYNYNDAKLYYQLNKNIMMEVFIPNREKLAEFDKSGVPWENIVAFIAHAKPEDKELYNLIHKKGAMCIVGSSRIYDKEYLAGKTDVYETIIKEGADIIEADLAIEAGEAILNLVPEKSSKSKYFGNAKLGKK